MGESPVVSLQARGAPEAEPKGLLRVGRSPHVRLQRAAQTLECINMQLGPPMGEFLCGLSGELDWRGLAWALLGRPVLRHARLRPRLRLGTKPLPHRGTSGRECFKTLHGLPMGESFVGSLHTHSATEVEPKGC